jgi:N6-L-threonylcarbamoyladenine synthase
LAQTSKAARRHCPRSILLVGGVACNSLLRRTFTEVFEHQGEICRVYCPSPILTTDNAAMIAAAGTPKLRRGAAADLNLNAFADLPLC